MDYGIEVIVHDPLADSEEAEAEYGIKLVSWKDMSSVDGLVLAVGHRAFIEMGTRELIKPLNNATGGVLMDVKGILDPSALPAKVQYWRL